MSQVPPLERQSSESRAIPERRVLVKDPAELPSNYSETPGGTIFSTTPGGTRIIYERRFLLQMKNSPLAKTPPVSLATIPDIINEDVAMEIPEKIKTVEPKMRNICSKDNQFTVGTHESEVFAMD